MGAFQEHPGKIGSESVLVPALEGGPGQDCSLRVLHHNSLIGFLLNDNVKPSPESNPTSPGESWGSWLEQG